MISLKTLQTAKLLAVVEVLAILVIPVVGQMIDRNKAPNTSSSGIAKTLAEEIGAGRGDVMTPDSSLFIINRDPFRAIRRGRQLFQRKFNAAEGQGPITGGGFGDINSNLAIGAGLSDSCALCHGRPRGSAGHGGNVVTRPDSRDAMHLFGLGLKEMLADEITQDLRSIRTNALATAQMSRSPVTRQLTSKGINYGQITANPDGSVDTSKVDGVDADLRVRPFFAHGGTISIREFVVGALNNEMGLQAVDPDLYMASNNHVRIVTPSGMVLDGSLDSVESPHVKDENDDVDGDGVKNEIPTSLVDYLEFYLLNYFKPGLYEQTDSTRHGLQLFEQAGCAVCHIQNLQINSDRRVADVETNYDPINGVFNNLFSTATPLVNSVNDGSGFPSLKQPRYQPFLVKNFFADLKRHDLGPNFHERNYDGTMTTLFMTAPLWGVGTTAPYGHDGRSANLTEVILRHGGEANAARDAFAKMAAPNRAALLDFLNALVIFPPDDTASNLERANPKTPNFPQFGHGSIKLTVLFNNPSDPE